MSTARAGPRTVRRGAGPGLRPGVPRGAGPRPPRPGRHPHRARPSGLALPTRHKAASPSGPPDPRDRRPSARRSPWTSTRAPPSRPSHRGDSAAGVRSRAARAGPRPQEAPPQSPPAGARAASAGQSPGSSRGDVLSYDPEAAGSDLPRGLPRLFLHSLTHGSEGTVAARVLHARHLLLTAFFITAVVEGVKWCLLSVSFFIFLRATVLTTPF